MIQLRDYQRACLDNLACDFDAGYRSLLIQAATGTGKTIMFLAWLDSVLGQDERALIMAHRSELITQPIQKARRFYPALAERMGIVMAERNKTGADIVVATVQTLNSNGRINDVLEHGPISCYVVDEAHHDSADTYRYVEDALRAANPDMLKTGWTATPVRTDRDGLVSTARRKGPYDRMSYRFPVQAAVRRGALCEFSAYAAGIPATFEGVDETESGWDDTQLGDILNVENVWDVVRAAWRGEIDGTPDCSSRQTITFTASVAQAHGGAEYFQRHGVAAEAVDGSTPGDERAAMLERFGSGQTQMLLNCAVLTEGWDAPGASCCLMVSPTKSPLVWVQKAGRILRLDPDNPNKHAVIVDFYPIERGNIFAMDALGVPKAVKDAKEAALEAGVLVGGWSVDRFGRALAVDTDRVVVRMLDLMSRSRFPWTLKGHYATTSLSENLAACIVLPDSERLEKAEELRRSGPWGEADERLYEHLRRVRLYRVIRKGWDWEAEPVGHYNDPKEAKKEVDEWPAEEILSSRRSKWRSGPATIKQISFLRRLQDDIPEHPTKGEASQLISEALTIQATKRTESWIERRIYQEG